jgi:hypothetical protein
MTALLVIAEDERGLFTSTWVFEWPGSRLSLFGAVTPIFHPARLVCESMGPIHLSIDGLMLDTTWHVLRQFVTSLLMAVYRNVAVPLGFAFGVAETVDVYDEHSGAFTQLFGIELQKHILESDQGSALSAVCKLK